MKTFGEGKLFIDSLIEYYKKQLENSEITEEEKENSEKMIERLMKNIS
jgi:hypothetical protein